MTVADELARHFDTQALGVQRDPRSERTWPLVAPASLAELRELFALAAAEAWKLLPVGGGTKLGWTRPVAQVDVALSTQRLAGVIAYEPGEGTVAARAGTSMSALAAAVAEGGHDLSPEVPHAGRATLGGVVGAGQSGRDRLRHGPLRDQVLGLQVVTPDGELTRSGGRLVKNVTGYDLHRLYTGSCGSLCVIVEVALRLHPRAPLEARITARQVPTAVSLSEAGAENALNAALALGRSALRPRSLVATLAAGGGATLALEFVGEERSLAWELATAEALLARCLPNFELDVEPPSPRPPTPPERTAGDALADRTHVVCFDRPSAVAGLWETARAQAGAAGHELLGIAEPLLGSLAFAVDAGGERSDGGEADAFLAALVRTLRGQRAAHGGRVHVRHASSALCATLEPLGVPGPELALMQRLRASFDPARRLAGPRLFPTL